MSYGGGYLVTVGASFLTIFEGPAAGKSVALNGELILGRAASDDGRLGDDPELSRRHAALVRQPDGQIAIEDLGSRNGTFVNGQRISARRVISLSDTIRVGQTHMRLSTSAHAEGAAPSESQSPAQLHPTLGPNGDGDNGRQRQVHSIPAPPAAVASTPPPPTGTPAVPPAPPQSNGDLTPFSGEGVLLHAGERITLTAAGVTVGRAPDNTIVLSSDRVSRHHARFDLAARGYYVTDLGSSNGIVVNGERIRSASRWLANGDTVMIGGEPIRYLAADEMTGFGISPAAPVMGTQSVQFDGQHMTIGRDSSNDVVLGDLNVSRFHAEVTAANGGYLLRDLGSRNGTRVNGRLVRSADLSPGSEIGIGPFRLIFDGAAFVSRDDRGALRLTAEKLSMRVKEKTILDQASIDVQPGEFVAIIGESGSGKSTMIKALAGVTIPTDGAVTVNGEPVTSRLAEIGYVPQDEIVHRDLTVREALTYAARLRLPQDSTDQEIAEAVHDVIDELALGEHADTRVGSLSGGQRKRAGVGTELVNHPGLLFLDEATTGLDPGLEARMMQLMRDLANKARAVVTITHATKNLGLCDKVAVMGRGGHLCFYGTPAEALEFFGAEEYDGIYTALESTPAQEWRQRFTARTGAQAVPAQPPMPPPALAAHERHVDRKLLPQAAILAGRYLKLMLRDRRNLLILLGQVPVLAVLVGALFHANVFDPTRGDIGSAPQLLFLLITLSIWIGSIDAAREIIKERAVFAREHAVGVRISAYILSKAMVLCSLATLQTVVLAAIVLAWHPLHGSGAALPKVFFLLVLTSWAAVGMGLFLSAIVNTENQATSFIPLALIPQLLFAGQIKPIREFTGPLKALAAVVFSHWSFAGIGTVVGLNHRFVTSPGGAVQLKHYGSGFFTLQLAAASGILLLFFAVFIGGVAMGLRRKRV